MNIERLKTYMKITAEDGMVITEWKEGENITGFTHCKQMYVPLSTDIEQLREITEAEKDRIEYELVREFGNFAQD